MPGKKPDEPAFHNQGLKAKLNRCCTAGDFTELLADLADRGAFDFPTYKSGLFPAVGKGSQRPQASGYANVWVRDNVHVANAHLQAGDTRTARRVATALARYFRHHAHRFRSIIQGRADPQDPMVRPHVRLDGRTLAELPQWWSHAQNDALGYFLWFYCRLIKEDVLGPREVDTGLLGLFLLFFRSIRFWRDEDSGHWEERRKVSASSIGTVVAGLRGLDEIVASGKTRITRERGLDPVERRDIRALTAKGVRALHRILPAECIQPGPGKARPHDAATLFLIYPLGVATEAQADSILAGVQRHLEGPVGIRRYLGDSYWAPDYRNRLAQDKWTTGDLADLDDRDRLIQEGQEAQWCIFDPILSVLFGRRFQATGRREYLESQRRYLERALGQITDDRGPYPALRCPELYFLEKGRYVPNDNVPLLWTQANLWTALLEMGRSLSSSQDSPGPRYSSSSPPIP